MLEADRNKMRQIKVKVEENSETVDKLVDTIVNKYNQEMTEEIEKIKGLLEQKDNLDDNEIENLVMRLPIFMYFASGGLETLGVESDMAKAVKMEVFNEKYIKSDGTIQDKTKIAEIETLNEHLVEVAFLRAYKKLKVQLEKADAVFSGAKKVLSKRMQDSELQRQDKN